MSGPRAERRRAARESARAPERGFVLIGVVMFVLALTILGLSLFGLSGFESQFLQRSYDSSEALFLAQGGVERAKFALAKRRQLALVQNLAAYPQGVYYACAWQEGGDSTKAVEADTTKPIRIRVGAEVGGERRMIEVQYKPRESVNLYKRLITVDAGIFVNHTQGSPPGPAPGGYDLCAQTFLTGPVREGVDDRAQWDFCAHTDGTYGRTVTIGGSPAPALPPFFFAHLGQTQAVPSEGPFDLTGPSGQVTFYRTSTADPDRPGFSVYVNDAPLDPVPVINVSGTAVWLLDHGFRSNQIVKVNGTPNDCLVIVSKQNVDTIEPQYNNIGIWFFAGLQSTSVPIILVTDGEVRLEHFNNSAGENGSTVVSYLSLFANNAWFSAPRATGSLRVYHDPDGPEDKADGLIERLCEVGALPNSGGLGMTFGSVAGTWKELDPDTPPVVN